MNNELLVRKSWLRRNWRWFLPTSLLLFLLLLGVVLKSTIDGNVMHVAQAYSDKSLFEKAIQKANLNQRVIEIIGKIEPIDRLAILEGHTVYTKNNNSVAMSIRVKGSKGKGKMDIFADKNGKEWDYKKINIRIKIPKETIQILDSTLETK